MIMSRSIANYLCCGLVFALAACSNTASNNTKSESTAASTNQKTAALEGVAAEATETETEKSENQEFAKVIRREGSVANRGGYIKILVNNSPITNFEIQRRAKFLQLRRVGGNRTKVAEKELIEQALKLNESRRLRTLASDAQVDQSYANFAKSNRVSPAQLSVELRKLGIGESHFKEFVRTQMSWNRSLQRFARAKSGGAQNERDVVTGLRKKGDGKPELTEYFFKRIVFVVPQSKRNSRTLATRKREAQAYRQRFPGCEQVTESIKSLRDVVSADERRVLEPEIPERWKLPVQKADAKGTTSVLETSNGVEFMAICSKRQVNDDNAAVVASRAEKFSDLNTSSTELEKEYLAQLRKAAVIVYQ